MLSKVNNFIPYWIDTSTDWMKCCSSKIPLIHHNLIFWIAPFKFINERLIFVMNIIQVGYEGLVGVNKCVQINLRWRNVNITQQASQKFSPGSGHVLQQWSGSECCLRSHFSHVPDPPWLEHNMYQEIYHPVNRLRSFLLLGHSVTRSLGHSVTRSLFSTC